MIEENRKNPLFNEIVVNSLDEYLENIHNYDALCAAENSILLFRGQKEVSWDLLPGLGRPNFYRPEIEKFESNILSEFKRRAIPFLPKTFDSKSNWEWLALAQHHKLPTRLLDWTENPLVALFFAFEHIKENKQDRAVWFFRADENEFADSNDSTVNPFTLDSTKVFVPNQITQRITAQSGWFTVHKYLKEKSKFLALNKNSTHRGRITKIVISNKYRDNFLLRLNRFGVNSFSIYPDLEGLSTFLSWKHFK